MSHLPLQIICVKYFRLYMKSPTLPEIFQKKCCYFSEWFEIQDGRHVFGLGEKKKTPKKQLEVRVAILDFELLIKDTTLLQYPLWQVGILKKSIVMEKSKIICQSKAIVDFKSLQICSNTSPEPYWKSCDKLGDWECSSC
jgi:hypothetical protein